MGSPRHGTRSLASHGVGSLWSVAGGVCPLPEHSGKEVYGRTERLDSRVTDGRMRRKRMQRGKVRGALRYGGDARLIAAG